ncbi:MAG: hypothetical protein ACFFDR_11045 [Candidatus Thorarchaeota archaeon]
MHPWGKEHLIWSYDEEDNIFFHDANPVVQEIWAKPYKTPYTTQMGPTTDYSDMVYLSVYREWNFKVTGIHPSDSFVVYLMNPRTGEKEIKRMKQKELEEFRIDKEKESFLQREPSFK